MCTLSVVGGTDPLGDHQTTGAPSSQGQALALYGVYHACVRMSGLFQGDDERRLLWKSDVNSIQSYSVSTGPRQSSPGTAFTVESALMEVLPESLATVERQDWLHMP